MSEGPSQKSVTVGHIKELMSDSTIPYSEVGVNSKEVKTKKFRKLSFRIRNVIGLLLL